MLQDSSDSEVDGAMGNNSSGASSPAVYYSPQYGVALGGKSLSPRQQMHIVADGARMRRHGTRRRPPRRLLPLDQENKTPLLQEEEEEEEEYTYPHTHISQHTDAHSRHKDTVKDSYKSRLPVDKDGRSTTSSDLSPSPLYEANIRDSFYSTAESGFETLPECNENEDDDDDAHDELSLSLQENYSQSSLKERSDRYFPSYSEEGGVPSNNHDGGDQANSSISGERTVIEGLGSESKSNSGGDLSAIEALSPHLQPKIIRSSMLPSSSKSSPAHKIGKVTDARLLAAVRKQQNFVETDDEQPLSVDTGSSVNSFSEEGEGEWCWDQEDQNPPEPVFPLARESMSDHEHHQQLMQRIHEWTAFAVNYVRSRSPTPECMSMNSSFMRRSRSLDRHLGEPVYVPDVDEISPAEPMPVEDVTIKNLECLETECHDIQGEFESMLSITNKLQELIHKSDDDVESESGTKHERSGALVNTHTSGTDSKPDVSQSSSVFHPIPHNIRGDSDSGNKNFLRDNSRDRTANIRGESVKDSCRLTSNSRHSSPSHQSQPVAIASGGRGRTNARRNTVRTRWERFPSVGGRSDDSRSSRASSVEYSWDCGEVGSKVKAMGPAGDNEEGERTMPKTEEKEKDSVENIGATIPILQYADQEWKGGTEKANTIKKVSFEFEFCKGCFIYSPWLVL